MSLLKTPVVSSNLNTQSSNLQQNKKKKCSIFSMYSTSTIKFQQPVSPTQPSHQALHLKPSHNNQTSIRNQCPSLSNSHQYITIDETLPNNEFQQQHQITLPHSTLINRKKIQTHLKHKCHSPSTLGSIEDLLNRYYTSTSTPSTPVASAIVEVIHPNQNSMLNVAAKQCPLPTLYFQISHQDDLKTKKRKRMNDDEEGVGRESGQCSSP